MPRMYHDDPKMTGGPTMADVPDEAVDWMRRCGWYLKPEPAQDETLPQGRQRNARSRSERQ